MIHPAATQADDQRWRNATTHRLVSARLRLVLAANRDPSHGYGGLGGRIVGHEGRRRFGNKLIASLSANLQKAVFELNGLAAASLKYCLAVLPLYGEVQVTSRPFRQKLVDQNIQPFDHGWIRDVSVMPLRSRLPSTLAGALFKVSRSGLAH